LVHLTVEYCTPAWCRSAHTRLIDLANNDALRTVIGCLRPTPAISLPILAGIQPAELRREGSTLSMICHAVEPGHLLHSALIYSPGGNARYFKSSHPFVPVEQQLINSSDDNNLRVALWVDHLWIADELLENTTRLRTFLPGIGTHPPRTALLRLNRFRCRTFPLMLTQMGYSPSGACECRAEEQTVDLTVFTSCPSLFNPSTSLWSA